MTAALDLLLHHFEGRAVIAMVCVAIPTALLGALLHLRRMALLTDAMAHAALPGMLLAWFTLGTLHPLALAAGAATSGAATAWITEWLAERPRIRPDAAIAAVFSVALAGGLLVLSAGVESVHLDVECLLFGNLLGLDDHSLALAAVLLVAVIVWVGADRRAIARLVFDPDHTESTGLRRARVAVPLALGTAVGAVVVFETTGVITGIALFVVPGAIAHLWARSFVGFLLGAVAVNLAIALVSLALVFGLDLSPAGAVASTAGAAWAAAALATRGGLGRRTHARSQSA
jgi:ABC-type Mn2+/Zn2+ transport system permease subunit